eukprot:gnl/MRDRNA2_/MRDRNA2_227456_c0_seq1.p1 gnl/MRDRNA2_/MRDRNA2_227456_c0~~gnl/MRDRNA2_/MRDRNA2_227456_c0_seq1.p1  ORF type:complete len:279 (-),score=51.25 gnl/MRDRNA2_/MRDRNA2_227456_c0_seq1:136-972(-)
MSNIQNLSAASHALRESQTFKNLLHVIAQLGSWINSADLQSQPGFALSSALGKLHQFRAFRGDRNLSLLHIVVLSASGGKHAEVKALGKQLQAELATVTEAARVDLRELGQCILACRSEADWLASEFHIAENSTDDYNEDARGKLKRIYQEFSLAFTDELENAWAETRQELEATLAFFAERVQPGQGWELCVENLLRTVDEFRRSFLRAVQEILQQPKRFVKAYAAMPQREKDACAICMELGESVSQNFTPVLGTAENYLEALKYLSDEFLHVHRLPE